MGAVSTSEVTRTWRSAKQSAVRQYGAGPEAERIVRSAVRRFVKWVAKHPRRTSRGDARRRVTHDRARRA